VFNTRVVRGGELLAAMEKNKGGRRPTGSIVGPVGNRRGLSELGRLRLEPEDEDVAHLLDALPASPGWRVTALPEVRDTLPAVRLAGELLAAGRRRDGAGRTSRHRVDFRASVKRATSVSPPVLPTAPSTPRRSANVGA